MLPEYREDFNRRFTPEKYARFLTRLEERCGTHVAFRNCETPCFFPEPLLRQMADAGAEMSLQLVGDAEYLAAADQAIPEQFRAARPTDKPLFIQADFGVVRLADGTLEPRLVEIQGFPSLYAYQIELAQNYSEVYDLSPTLTPLLGSHTAEQYRKLVSEAILGGHDPENVVLLEIDPGQQKTLADFLLTEKMCGVRTVDVTKVRKHGRKLFYERERLETPIERIYNRVIVDELVRRQIPIDFSFRDELDVEWAGHPDWFFRISKFSLPYLRHRFVPRSQFLNEVRELPDAPEKLVLKPLFSFAGLGVKVGPSREEINTILDADRKGYLLQERLRFEPVIETPFGLTNAEIRIMYIWADKPEAVTTIVRMGRGKMMGVDHNKNTMWVGASAGFINQPVVL